MKFLNNDLTGLDETYGIRFDGTRFTFGDSVVTMGDNELEIGEERYMATPGLMELLFMKSPNMSLVDSEDKKQYKNILTHTNAHRKRYSSSGEINVIKSHPKWAVISSLFKYEPRKQKLYPYNKAKRGFGAIDLNHLIERLKVLLPSREQNSKSEIEFFESKLRNAGVTII